LVPEIEDMTQAFLRIRDVIRKTWKSLTLFFHHPSAVENRNRKKTELLDGNEDYARFMMAFHSKLVQSRDISRIDFAEYLRNLTGQLSRLHKVDGDGVAVRIDVDDVFLGADTTILCGFIIQELVSNALKHAFPAGRDGEVLVDMRSERNHELVLRVCDNGVGLPGQFDLQQAGSLGLRLVAMLVDQLKGDIELDRKEGTAFRITFTEPKLFGVWRS
jgi:two-component sensor histidine kinase